MQYASIIRLIDQQLERLQAVRQLLRGNASPQIEIQTQLQPEPPPELTVPVEAEMVAPAPTSAVGSVRAPKGVRRRRSSEAPVRMRVTKPVMPRALSSKIPTGPVVVSAQAVALHKAVAVAPKAVPVAAPAEGTLEALLREVGKRS